jgi:tyrosinase
MHLSRRTLLSIAVRMGLSSRILPLVATAQAQPLRVRENIETFAANAGKVRALRAAVGRMKTRSAANRHDPLSWDYWAAIHGTTARVTPQDPRDPNGNRIYSQCKHSTSGFEPHFLSWHRPFLFFFEAVLKQAAQEAGETAQFELPYWDWYSTPRINRIFTEGTPQANPLFHPRLITDLTGTVLDRAAFANRNLLTGPGVGQFQTFSLPFEDSPHGQVHNLVGRDMGDIQTSARDPIFWLHHANVDRLWTAWMKLPGRVLPAADSAWGRTAWIFDPAGRQRGTARAALTSAAPFNYRYEDESLPQEMVAMASESTRVIDAAPQSLGASSGQSADAPVTLSATGSPISLGDAPVAVNLRLGAEQTGRVRSLSPGAGPDTGSGKIVLDGIEIGPDGAEGGFSYRVVASLPGAGGQPERRVTLGALGTFTLSMPAHEGGGDHAQHGNAGRKRSLEYPLADVLQALNVSDPAELERGLRITLEPTQPPEPSARTSGAAVENVRIEAIRLEVPAGGR